MNAALEDERPALRSDEEEQSQRMFIVARPDISEDSATLNTSSAVHSFYGTCVPQPPQAAPVAKAPILHVILQPSQTTLNTAIASQVFIDVSSPKASNERTGVKNIFNELAEKWKKETGGCSLTIRRYAHPSYQSILTLGESVIPLILLELQQRPDWWFEALKALAKTDPTTCGDNFKDAVSAWLRWGKQRNLIP